MKFGKTFISHQIPEWSSHYMNYKLLKKQIKSIVNTEKQVLDEIYEADRAYNEATEPSASKQLALADTLTNDKVQIALADFFFKIDRNIEKVDSFYNLQFAEYERRFKKVSTAIISNTGPTASVSATYSTKSNHPDLIFLDKEEYEEIINILIELRSNFRNLKWFGELNKRAFIKILKKMDKKTGTNKQILYLSTRIFPSSFANENEILNILNLINGYLSEFTAKANELVSLTTPNIEDPHSPMSDTFGKFISNNDPDGLMGQLIVHYRSLILVPSKIFIKLLNKCTISLSYRCIDRLLDAMPTLFDTTDISGRNFFHHHIITLGKHHQSLMKNSNLTNAQENINNYHNNRSDLSIAAAAEPETTQRLFEVYGSDGSNSTDIPNGLIYILEKIPATLRPTLLQSDTYKRTALHYAAQYGLKETARVIMSFLDKWGQWNWNISIDDVLYWGDAENMTPLHLSLIGSHPLTTKALLLFMAPDVSITHPDLILLAARLTSKELLENLIGVKGIDINYTNLHFANSNILNSSLNSSTNNGETPLYISCKSNAKDCVEFLLSQGANCEIPESTFGWTPIFIAAAEGFSEIAKLLIEKGNANYDILDESGWYPMEHASLRGHLDLAETLRPKVGYDPLKLAKESSHKVSDRFSLLKNSVNCAESSDEELGDGETLLNTVDKKLKQLNISNGANSSIEMLPTMPKHKSLEHVKTLKDLKSDLFKKQKGINKDNNLPPKQVTAVGHKALKQNESIVMITLGTTYTRPAKCKLNHSNLGLMEPVINLNRVPVSRLHSTQLDTALSVRVSCKQLSGTEPTILDLPLDDTHGSATDPIVFKFSGIPVDDAVFYFDIVPTYSYNDSQHQHPFSHDLISPAAFPNVGVNDYAYFERQNSRAFSHHSNPCGNAKTSKTLGRAICLLKNVYTDIGENLCSLNSVVTLPIIESDTLEELGTIRFEVLRVNNFAHPNSIACLNGKLNDLYWKKLISTRVIGHRGMGKNVNTSLSLQLGENTVDSFIYAASLGASYVEFDVQLTKDYVPVIYHDFLVAESGVEVPMHLLTAKDFLQLSESHHNSQNSNDFSGSSDHDNATLSSKYIRRNKSHHYNLNGKKASLDDDVLLSHRMNGFDPSSNSFKQKKFKGNSRGSSIASSFATLEELFKKLPESVGFNIECKYPMLDEAENEDFEPTAISLNKWVDVVLNTVFDNKGERNVIFSSFHPDICIMLSLKQPAIPILFLTEGGSNFMADIRASSLQEAIRFAKKWNLLGIVSAANPIVQCPRLAGVVKSNGLVFFTYGTLNNDPENARLEVEAGVDAVIVDKVLAVRKGLTGSI